MEAWISGGVYGEPSFVSLVVADRGLVNGAVGVGLFDFGRHGRVDFGDAPTQSTPTKMAAIAALHNWRNSSRPSPTAAERWSGRDTRLLR